MAVSSEWDLLVFATALAIAASAPGPSLAAIVAMVLSNGARQAIWFSIGVICGDLTWLTLSLSGLALITQKFPMIFVMIKWAGVFYLMYLAIKIWHSPPIATAAKITTEEKNRLGSIVSGFSVTMGNPKAILFYLALLPTLIKAEQLSLTTAISLGLIVIAVLTIVFACYILAASKARQLMANNQSVRSFNRATATALLSAAIWIAAK